MWNPLTHEEINYCREVIKEFKRDRFLIPLVNQIDEIGFNDAVKPFLFELRFAKALKDRGITPEYEKQTVEGTSVDFYYTSPKGRKVYCELVSIGISQAVERATKKRVDDDGVEWSGFSLSSNKEDVRESEEGEVLLFQQKICEKVQDIDKPVKFPALEKSNADFHVIAVDTRGFLGGGGGDEFDWGQLTYGNGIFRRKEMYAKFWTDPKTGVRKPILGLFEKGSTRPRGVDILKERVHGILFLKDGLYKDGSLMKSPFLAHNPWLIEDGR